MQSLNPDQMELVERWNSASLPSEDIVAVCRDLGIPIYDDIMGGVSSAASAIPCWVQTKDGGDFPRSVIILEGYPPVAQCWKRRIRLLDEIERVLPSPYALSHELCLKLHEHLPLVAVVTISTGEWRALRSWGLTFDREKHGFELQEYLCEAYDVPAGMTELELWEDEHEEATMFLGDAPKG